MAKQRFEGAFPPLNDNCRAAKPKTLSHKGIDEVDLDARVGSQIPDRPG
jgi:hypothetical protein